MSVESEVADPDCVKHDIRPFDKDAREHKRLSFCESVRVFAERRGILSAEDFASKSGINEATCRSIWQSNRLPHERVATLIALWFAGSEGEQLLEILQQRDMHAN